MQRQFISLKEVDLRTGSILKSLLYFSIPIFFSIVFQQLYNAIDTMIVGNFLGEEALAAIGANVAIFELMVGFEQGIGNGFSIVVARAFGKGDQKLLKKAVAGATISGAVITIIVTVAASRFMYRLLQILGTPEEIIDAAHSYIYTITIFVGVMFLYNLLSGFLRGIGNSMVPVIVLVISSVINVVLDLLFISVFQMGVFGAAMATVLAQGVSVIICAIYIVKKCRILLPGKEHFHVEKELYQELVFQGLSMGFMSAIVSSGSIILQSGINHFGTMIIAGHTAARKLFALSSSGPAAMCSAIATFASQNKGANQKARVKKGVRYANLILLGWCIFITIIVGIFGKQMIILISGSYEETVVSYGRWYLMIASPFYSVLGALLVYRNCLQGLGNTVMPIVSSMIELIGKIIFTVFVIPAIGVVGILICEPVIWCIMTIHLFWCYKKAMEQWKTA